MRWGYAAALVAFCLIVSAIPNAANSATGGTITEDGPWIIHTFTSNGTLVIDGSINASVLIVAGGGGGGSNASTGNGGGGGGGGIRFISMDNLTGNATTLTGNLTVVVGLGGAVDTNGQDSSLGAISATGGGKGGKYNAQACGTGGSGGGGAQEAGVGCAGTFNQGTSGGAGSSSTTHHGGGGGGAGGAAITATTKGGAGGLGAWYMVSGVLTCLGGGGGGSTHNAVNAYALGGCSASGGGGDGQGKSGGVARAPTAGAANTGNGGGGGGEANTGAAGGSGIVIVKYLNESFLGGCNQTMNLTKAMTSSSFNNLTNQSGCIVNLTISVANASQSYEHTCSATGTLDEDDTYDYCQVSCETDAMAACTYTEALEYEDTIVNSTYPCALDISNAESPPEPVELNLTKEMDSSTFSNQTVDGDCTVNLNISVANASQSYEHTCDADGTEDYDDTYDYCITNCTTNGLAACTHAETLGFGENVSDAVYPCNLDITGFGNYCSVDRNMSTGEFELNTTAPCNLTVACTGVVNYSDVASEVWNFSGRLLTDYALRNISREVVRYDEAHAEDNSVMGLHIGTTEIYISIILILLAILLVAWRVGVF